MFEAIVVIGILLGVIVLGCIVGRGLAMNNADDAAVEMYCDIQNGQRCVDCHAWIDGEPPYFPRRCEACRDKEWRERGGF